jgi:hypothetical protein
MVWVIGIAGLGARLQEWPHNVKSDRVFRVGAKPDHGSRPFAVDFSRQWNLVIALLLARLVDANSIDPHGANAVCLP